MLTLISVVLYSQQNRVSQESLNKILCKKWMYTFTTSHGTKMEDVFQFQIDFRNDLTMSFYNMGEVQKGNWCYDKDLNAIRIFTNKTAMGFIVVISEKELILVKDSDFQPFSTKLPSTYSVLIATDTSNKPKQRS